MCWASLMRVSTNRHVVTVATGCLRDWLGRERYTGRAHHFVKRIHRHGRRLIITESVAFCDRQRSPALLILLMPDFDLGALSGEKTNHRRKVLVGGAVHCCLAIVVDGINIVSKFEHYLDSFHGFALGAGIL